MSFLSLLRGFINIRVIFFNFHFLIAFIKIFLSLKLIIFKDHSFIVVKLFYQWLIVNFISRLHIFYPITLNFFIKMIYVVRWTFLKPHCIIFIIIHYFLSPHCMSSILALTPNLQLLIACSLIRWIRLFWSIH